MTMNTAQLVSSIEKENELVQGKMLAVKKYKAGETTEIEFINSIQKMLLRDHNGMPIIPIGKKELIGGKNERS
jgi:hypothetical protein